MFFSYYFFFSLIFSRDSCMTICILACFQKNAWVLLILLQHHCSVIKIHTPDVNEGLGRQGAFNKIIEVLWSVRHQNPNFKHQEARSASRLKRCTLRFGCMSIRTLHFTYETLHLRLLDLQQNAYKSWPKIKMPTGFLALKNLEDLALSWKFMWTICEVHLPECTRWNYNWL